MSDHRMGTCTVCRTVVTLPNGRGPAAVGLLTPAGTNADGGRSDRSGRPSPVCLGTASVAGQLAVGGPVRPRRLGAEPLDLVLLVVGEVALEPEPLRVTLVGEDVRRD